jgi:hypothetical protein
MTRTSVESETPTSRERLEVSGIKAYFVERTPLVLVQNFHVELTSTKAPVKSLENTASQAL